MDLIHEVPPVAVEGSRTFCDGGGGPLGHPKVFINVVRSMVIMSVWEDFRSIMW